MLPNAQKSAARWGLLALGVRGLKIQSEMVFKPRGYCVSSYEFDSFLELLVNRQSTA
jgi:hypothetical protein